MWHVAILAKICKMNSQRTSVVTRSAHVSIALHCAIRKR